MEPRRVVTSGHASSSSSHGIRHRFEQRRCQAMQQTKRVVIEISGYRYEGSTANEVPVDETFEVTAKIPSDGSGESFMGKVKDRLRRRYGVDKHAITFYGSAESGYPDALPDCYRPRNGEVIMADFRRRRTDAEAERVRRKKKSQRRRKRRAEHGQPPATAGASNYGHRVDRRGVNGGAAQRRDHRGSDLAGGRRSVIQSVEGWANTVPPGDAADSPRQDRTVNPASVVSVQPVSTQNGERRVGDERKPTPVGAESRVASVPMAEIVDGQGTDASADAIAVEYLSESEGSDHVRLHTWLTRQATKLQRVKIRLPGTCDADEGLSKELIFSADRRQSSFTNFPPKVPMINVKCPFCRQEAICEAQGSRVELRASDRNPEQFDGDTGTMCHISGCEQCRDGELVYAPSCCSKLVCGECLLSISGSSTPEVWRHWHDLCDAVGDVGGPGAVVLSFRETEVKVPVAIYYASVRYNRRITALNRQQVETVAANMHNADRHGVVYRVSQQYSSSQQWFPAICQPCKYSDVSGEHVTEGAAAVMFAVIDCQRERVKRDRPRRQADERITNLDVRGDRYLQKTLVFDCCPACLAGSAQVWMVEDPSGMCDSRQCSNKMVVMLTCCNSMRCRECLVHHVLIEEMRAVQAAKNDVLTTIGSREDGIPRATVSGAAGSDNEVGEVQGAVAVVSNAGSGDVRDDSARDESIGSASADPVALQAAMTEVLAIRGVESDGVGATARSGVSTGGVSSYAVNLVSSEGTSDEEPSLPAPTHDEVNGVTDDSDAFLSESDEFLPSGSDSYSPVDHDHASFLEKSPYRPPEPSEQLAARLFGAALFTNRGHSTAGRIQSRLQDPVTTCGRANRAVKDRGSSGEGWARFRVFRPDQRFKGELAAFRERVAGSLVASTGSGEFLYTSDAVGFVGGAAAGSQVLSSGEPMWAGDRTDVLMLAVKLVDVWPDFDSEVAELYQLFQPIVPVLNRSKAGEEDRCPMHVIGLRQRSAGSCCMPTLLKLNGGGANADFDNWQGKAARFYAKVQCLEELVAPAAARARKRIRDQTKQGMCCAIPGLEEFLYALSASLTAEYYPGLHLDTADVEAASGVGTLECIVFSSHPEAVFVAARTALEGGSDSQGVKVIELRSPTLILLDSTRVYHAACKNLAAAQYALEAMRSNTGVEAGVSEASAADDSTRRQCSSARSIEDAVLRFEVPSATEVSEFCWRSGEYPVPSRVTVIQLPADGDCLCHCLLYWLRHAAAMNRLDERQRVLNSSATSLTVAGLRKLFDTLHQRPGGLYDRLNNGVGTSRRGGHWGTGAAYMTHSREGYGKYVTTAGRYLSADQEVGAIADAWGFGCMVWPGWAMHHTDHDGAVQYYIALHFYRNHYNLIALDGSPVLRREDVMDASFRSIADKVAAKQKEHVQQAERDQNSRDAQLAHRIAREEQKEQEEQERLRKSQIEGDAEMARRLSKRARTGPQRFGQGPSETAKVTRQRKKNQAGPSGPGRGEGGRGKGGSDGQDQ